MKIDYADGKLSFDLGSFLDGLPPSGKKVLVESLACDDEIINHVAAQILDGCTESGYYGATCCTAPAETQPGNALDHARRCIALRSSEVAEREIKRLQEAVKHHEANYLKACDEIRELRNQLAWR